ncbi:MAG: hypothetical protein ACE5JI_10325 [Acidobacteriota bacterium]
MAEEKLGSFRVNVGQGEALSYLSKDPEAVPDVDEVAALPLDVWAREQGFRKLHPNLAGI